MILIADSGSTKTNWRLTNGQQPVCEITTTGINPYFQTEEEIGRTISDLLLTQLPTNEMFIDEVHFYGAGCTPDKAVVVQRALSTHISAPTIEVNTDMLAAARGLCGQSAGIVCIMGTGSNTCFYDGAAIAKNVSPLGFILGDEGSGAVLGKLLVGDLLKGVMPATLKDSFLQRFSLTPNEIIDRVYRQPFPNRFLAGFAPFIAEHLSEPTIYNLVYTCIQSFFVRNVKQYDYLHYPVHFVGSIAFHFQDIVSKVADGMGVQTGQIMQSPMDGLIAYHQSIS